MDEPGSQRGRRIASIVLATLGALALLLGGMSLYASHSVFDSDQFAKRASDALADERVSERVAEAIVEDLLEGAEPNLINARPVLLTATDAVVSSPPFRAVFREAVRRAHRTLFTRDRDSLVLNLADATTLAIDSIESISPRIAERVPTGVQPKLQELVENGLAIDLAQIGEKLRFLGIVFPLLGLLLLSGAAGVDRDRRRGFLTVAVAVATASALGFAGLLIARAIVIGQVDVELQDAARAVWQSYLGDLAIALVVATGLALLLAAAVTTRRRADPLAPLRTAGEYASRTPATTLGRVGRAVAVLVIGAFFVLRPDLALHLVVVAIGAYAVFFALCELMLLIAPPAADEDEGEPVWRRTPIRVTVAGGAVAALAALVVVLVVGGDDERRQRHVRAPGSIERCNGFAELCDRPLNDVAFPSVHNAMSSAADGYLLPNNERPIPEQLEAGVRGLLIDAHWGIPGGRFVVTDLQAEGGKGKARAEAVASTSEEFVETAERLVERISAGKKGGGPKEVFFCHVFCELGATPAVRLLNEVGDFLDTHPDDVVIIFIEDYVAPAEIAKVFEKADLLPFVYTHERDQPLPLLRNMIAADRRLFVMAENTGGGDKFPWYHQGFELAQETPFTFHSPAELEAASSCAPNRGTPDSPLFQLNHWVEEIPRSPRTASVVNSREFLLERAQRCDQRRDLRSNLVAVDFWEQGDLFEVVNILNGLPADAVPEYAETEG